jgi:hypothetical protein
LATSKLVARSSDSLENDGSVALTTTNREENLSNVDSSDSVVWLSVGTSHTSLKSIGTGAGQHLVDSDDVERVNTDSHVERVLSCSLGDVLVGANTSGFECFRSDLLVLVADQVGAEGEFVYIGLLSPQVEDADLRVRYYNSDRRHQYIILAFRLGHSAPLTTSVVSALRERLVLAVSIASRRA